MIKSALQIKLEIYRLIDTHELDIAITLGYEEHPIKRAELKDRLVMLKQLKDEILNLGFSVPLNTVSWRKEVIP